MIDNTTDIISYEKAAYERALQNVMTDRAISPAEGSTREDIDYRPLAFDEPVNRRGRRHEETSQRQTRRSTHRTMLRARHN